jgi:RNA polymerase sigma-70 factor (ECF subfamily)
MERSPEQIQDEWLVIRCQAGESDALVALVSRWQPRLLRLSRRLTGDREAAAEIVQDAWLAIVRGLPKQDDPAGFRGWAYRIVANRCRDWIRRRIVRRGAAAELRERARKEQTENSGHWLETQADGMRLKAALRNLDDESRAILGLHYLDGLGLSEIGAVLELPVGTIKSRLHAARERLRQSMRNEDERN